MTAAKKSSKTAAKSTPKTSKKVSFTPVDTPTDDHGRMVALPGDEWDASEHDALKREDFSDDSIYLDWRAHIADVKARALSDKATKLRERADTLRKYGDPEKLNKVVSLRQKLAVMEDDLKADGIDL